MDQASGTTAGSRWAVLAGALLLTACASLSGPQEIEARALADSPAPGERPAPSAAQLRAVVGDGDLAFVTEVSRIESAIARRPLIGGNRVQLLKDGPETHRAQLKAIAGARRHIHLDIYLITDEELGQRYADALTAKARAGVRVRLIVDGLGGMGAGEAFRRRLEEAGVEIREFNSVNPLKDPRLWRVTRRNHRKILVVDGDQAFTGGINITDDYSGSSSGGSRIGSRSGGGSGSRSKRGWRDTQVSIEGPVVAEFQRQFLRWWGELGGKVEDPPQALFPPIRRRGDQMVRVVVDQGQDLLDNLMAPADGAWDALRGRKADESRIYASYITAIGKARQRVWITQAYFAPNEAFVAALEDAAKRGVDVRLMMPGESDVNLMMHAARSHYQRLLDAGIHLYEYQDTVLHAKTAVIDGAWSTVGSANLDYRSFILNDEANAVVIGRDFGWQMEQMFEQDMKSARAIDPRAWGERPWTQRLKERGAAAIKWGL
ncbi:cardiolipin synthase B [Solimonas sp. K1W22B-7]|uniref:phospholipase D-like domain-containing protein n=1 Tax=Solimonas sp. K1W22B-7 TaxID=2303331 RepID=UPI000E32F45B|nr:phospholipase D-like domain-containing protein [Solimonas sp. K1W22B-7]AXQ28102.1 cardiolipin synthase B [Solimonas sp. K1W22B-7]